MNNQEHKESVVNQIVGDATARLAEQDAKVENVQIKVIDGEVFISSQGLITVFELNKKRKTLSKAEVKVFEKMIEVLKIYHGQGLKIALEETFQTGDVVEYKGGQLPNDRPQLSLEKSYYVESSTNGFFPGPNGGIWKPCLFLVGIYGPEEAPEKRPAFLASMFKKVQSSEEPKVVSIESHRTEGPAE